ncbi:MAG: hypothetical protein ABJA02_07620 [Acidobacteriota bacterium]
MSKLIVERDVEVVRDTGGGGNSTGSSAIWAIAMIIIVALIAGAVYYSGILRTRPSIQPAQKVNVEIKTP